MFAVVAVVDCAVRRSTGNRRMMRNIVSGADAQKSNIALGAPDAEEYYVACGAWLPSETLRSDLKIPLLDLKTGSASECDLSDERRSSLLGYINQAEEALSVAAQSYDKALQTAGWTEPSLFYGRGLVSRRPRSLLGPVLDNRGAKSGARQMQEVETQQGLVVQAILAINSDIAGMASLQAPRWPMAMTVLLQLLASSNIDLALCNHPVIVALYQSELTRETAAWQQMGGLPGSYQYMGGYPAGQAGGVLGGRRRGLLRPRGRARNAIGGALAGGQQEEKAMARFLSGNICLADRREFQRLTQQFEQLRQWLMF